MLLNRLDYTQHLMCVRFYYSIYLHALDTYFLNAFKYHIYVCLFAALRFVSLKLINDDISILAGVLTRNFGLLNSYIKIHQEYNVDVNNILFGINRFIGACSCA